MSKEKTEYSAWKKFLLHIHPPKISQKALALDRTFGLGGISTLLFIILAFTGVMLRFKYMPTVDGAYQSIRQLENNYFLGQLLRNIHYWSANLMIMVVILHVIRVVLSQSIYYERAKNWKYGVILLFFTLAFSFTGYLLPWDQLSYWAVSIMVNIFKYIPIVGTDISIWIKGGEDVGQQTLLTFYTLHTGILPLAFLFLMMIHFYLVRKAKGVTYVLKDGEDDKKVDTYPHLVRLEIIAALAVIATLLLLSILFNAPLKDMANPDITPNPSKAPWYFIGLQEMLLHFHPILVLFTPIVTAFIMLRMPRWRCQKEKIGHWFGGKENKKTIISTAWQSVLWATLICLADDILRSSSSLNLETGGIYGIIIFIFFLIPIFLIYRKYRNTTPSLRSILMFTFISSSYITMGAIAYFLRAEGMTLIFL
ncbi:MAG: cytochrome b N-terminal domain-containing protein [Bacteroidales bacterium]